jgi:hypothetical protein
MDENSKKILLNILIFFLVCVGFGVLMYFLITKKLNKNNSLSYTEKALIDVTTRENYEEINLFTGYMEKAMMQLTNTSIVKDFYKNTCGKDYPSLETQKNFLINLYNNRKITNVNEPQKYASLPLIQSLIFEKDQNVKEDMLAAFFIYSTLDKETKPPNVQFSYNKETKTVQINSEGLLRISRNLSDEDKMFFKIPIITQTTIANKEGFDETFHSFKLEDFRKLLFKCVIININETLSLLKQDKIYLDVSEYNSLPEDVKKDSILIDCKSYDNVI